MPCSGVVLSTQLKYILTFVTKCTALFYCVMISDQLDSHLEVNVRLVQAVLNEALILLRNPSLCCLFSRSMCLFVQYWSSSIYAAQSVISLSSCQLSVSSKDVNYFKCNVIDSVADTFVACQVTNDPFYFRGEKTLK